MVCARGMPREDGNRQLRHTPIRGEGEEMSTSTQIPSSGQGLVQISSLEDMIRERVAEERGRAFGALHAITGAAVLPANAVFGFIFDTHPERAFLIGASFALQIGLGRSAGRGGPGSIVATLPDRARRGPAPRETIAP